MLLHTLTRVRPRLVLAAAVTLLVGLGCKALDVQNPDIVDPTQLTGPSSIPAFRNGVIGDYALAVDGDNGANEGQILVSGSFSDELVNSETFPTRIEYDRRTIDIRNGTLTTLFRNLHRARRAAEVGARQIAIATPAAQLRGQFRIPELLSLAGFTYIFMGENYCSGVPIGDFDANGSLVFGDPLSTTQLFDRAIERFDSALASPDTTPNVNVRLLAAVGKGRALLDQGRFAEAAVAVAAVPTGFSYVTTHTGATNRQHNGMFRFINTNERFSVADLDGGNGLNFRTATDPRVLSGRFPANDVGFDAKTPQYDQGKYFPETSSVPVATGIESRLIQAEAALAAGDPTTWLTTLNTLRSTPGLVAPPPPGSSFVAGAALQPLSDTLADVARTPAAARRDVMFRERAFWLFLTGHRLGDLRRLVRQYSMPADSVYPGGGGKPYVVNGNDKGGAFGTDYNLPVPFDELNNPKFVTCISRSP
jgi:hypothetical protein